MNFQWKVKGCLIAALMVSAPVSLIYAGPVQSPQRVDQIEAQQLQIRAEVKAAKNGWDAVPQEKRTELLARQERLLTLLAGSQVFSDLSPADQVEVANTLEWIKALATNAEDERQICRRERKTGSNRIITTCRTVAAMRTEREMAKDAMRLGETLSRTPMKGAAGGL